MDGGLSRIEFTETENKVRQGIQDKELQLPEFDKDCISQLKDTNKYPPEGSSQSNA